VQGDAVIRDWLMVGIDSFQFPSGVQVASPEGGRQEDELLLAIALLTPTSLFALSWLRWNNKFVSDASGGPVVQ